MKNNYKNWIDKIPLPKEYSNKYTRGSVLIIGGEKNSTGAARMAALSAARMSAGMVTVACSYDSLDIYASSLLSVMVRAFANAVDLQEIIQEKKINAILVGPGLAANQKTCDLIMFLKSQNLPLVIDAGGLTAISQNQQIKDFLLRGNIVITPHQGEFKRLFGEFSDPINAVNNICKEYPNITLLLKGNKTFIGYKENLIINEHSHPALSTAGSGDVLAGMIVSLMASGCSSFEACQIASYFHGEIAINHGYGLIAEDIIIGIPQALAKLLSPKKD